LQQVIEADDSQLSEAITLATSAAFAQAVGNFSSIKSQGSTLYQEDRTFEPAGARVDGVVCLDYIIAKSQTTGKRTDVDKSVRWIDSFFKLASNFPTFRKKCKEVQGARVKKVSRNDDDDDENDHKNLEERQKDPHEDCLMAPCITTSLPIISSPPVSDSAFPKFYVPFIFAEYKRSTQSLNQAYRQIQMYCIFGVEFLASIGVTDFPVWGIVTAATRGSIVMAWKSGKSTKKASRQSSSQQQVSFVSDLLVMPCNDIGPGRSPDGI
jgi:hypothetical protein